MSITINISIEQILEKVNDIIQQYGVRDKYEDEVNEYEINEYEMESLFIPITIEQVDDDLSELGLDSLSFIRLIVSLEEEYNVEFKDEDLILSNMNTVKKIFSAVQRLLKS